MDTIIDDILQCIKGKGRIILTGHKYPDGDAVGSALALYRLLRKQGKQVLVLFKKSQIGVSSILEDFASITDIGEYDFGLMPELLICLDCSDSKRICDERICGWIGRIPTINIDHHGKELFGDFNLVIKDYSSTGELVYDLAKAANWRLDRQAAESLWVSIVTDTNQFSRGVQSSTMYCAAELLSLGVRASWLNDVLFLQEPINVFELRKRAVNSLELWNDGLVSVISLQVDDFEETGCTKQDTDNFPNIPLSIKGSKIAVFIYPLMVRNEVRISFRSREGCPVSAKKIAEHFGGSGHEHSAGAVFYGSVNGAKEAVRSFLLNGRL